jgi:hypothetical protein
VAINWSVFPFAVLSILFFGSNKNVSFVISELSVAVSSSDLRNERRRACAAHLVLHETLLGIRLFGPSESDEKQRSGHENGAGNEANDEKGPIRNVGRDGAGTVGSSFWQTCSVVAIVVFRSSAS